MKGSLVEVACFHMPTGMAGWRGYRIEYGGHADACVREGVIYLPPNGAPERVEELLDDAARDADYQRRHRERLLNEAQYNGRQVREWILRGQLAEAEVKRLEKVVGDLISLASAAMSEANNDGAEYDIDGELAEARAALKEYARKEEERG